MLQKYSYVQKYLIHCVKYYNIKEKHLLSSHIYAGVFVMGKNILSTIKYESTAAVYNLIISKKKIKRAEIADITGLSLMTVGKIVDAFLSGGLIIQEKEINNFAGRRVGIIEPNNTYSYLIIDISNNDFKALHFNACGTITGNFSYKYNKQYYYDENVLLFLNELRIFYKNKNNIFGAAIIIPQNINFFILGNKNKTDVDIISITKQTISDYINSDNIVYTDFINSSIRYYCNIYNDSFLYIRIGLQADGVYVNGSNTISPADINGIILHSGSRLGEVLLDTINTESLANDIAILINNYYTVLMPNHIIVGTGSNIVAKEFNKILLKKINSYIVNPVDLILTEGEEPYCYGAYDLLCEQRLKNFIKSFETGK